MSKGAGGSVGGNKPRVDVGSVNKHINRQESLRTFESAYKNIASINNRGGNISNRMKSLAKYMLKTDLMLNHSDVQKIMSKYKVNKT